MAEKLHEIMSKMDADYGAARRTSITHCNSTYQEDAADKAIKAIKDLADVSNSQSTRFTADVIFEGLTNQHRYLQSELVESMIGALSRYADASYDGRNKYAVAQCRLLDETIEEHHLGAAKERN